tara:strand:+ start:20 stop:337 length:318 start_codon:yes stop_codon:yes gene_type:complete
MLDCSISWFSIKINTDIAFKHTILFQRPSTESNSSKGEAPLAQQIGLSMRACSKVCFINLLYFPLCVCHSHKERSSPKNAFERELLKAFSDPLRLQIIESLSKGE